jgi:hypothetical protein
MNRSGGTRGFRSQLRPNALIHMGYPHEGRIGPERRRRVRVSKS